MYIKKLKNGKYQFILKYQDKEGKTQKASITLKGNTKAIQKHALEKLEEKVQFNLEKDDIVVKDSTLNIVYDQWLVTLKNQVRNNSYTSYISAIKSFVKKYSNWNINDIKPIHVQNYLVTNGWKIKTIKHKKVILFSLFDYARKMTYIKFNPVSNVVLPKNTSSIEDFEISENKTMTYDELKIVLEYCRMHNKNQRLTLIMEFLFLTGLRLEELGGLQKSSVDFEKQTIKIKHVIDTKATGADSRNLYLPKTFASRREIYVNDRCVEILKWFFDNSLDDETFVFTTMIGTTVKQSATYLFVKNVCESALGKQKNRKYNIHMLRHAHISLLAELDIPIKATMKRVGHSQESTTLRIYSHVSQKMNDSIMRKLNEI
ncbi:tyrosine-type recombinase/integrase [Lactococcus formosensis]|uniref:tyrosine-type recombinase/integrase n=1 Tax=Lactococcus formosensis TaxID=1281486 RepID=UPI0022E97186|nr:site-specific integrase [Lactococcus formosensis]